MKFTLCDLFSRNTGSSLARTRENCEASRMRLIVLRSWFRGAQRWALARERKCSVQIQNPSPGCVLILWMPWRQTIRRAATDFHLFTPLNLSSPCCFQSMDFFFFSTRSPSSVSCIFESLNPMRLRGFPPPPSSGPPGTNINIACLVWARRRQSARRRLLLAAGWRSARLYASLNSVSPPE